MTSSPIPPDRDDAAPPPAPLKFPSVALRGGSPRPAQEPQPTDCANTDEPETGQEALDTIDRISRRIDLLARDLGCLGYFDDDDDRPRAA